jgi:hypothetical protein
MSKRKKHRPDMRKVARGGAGIKELGMSNLLNSQPKAINATVPDNDEQPTTLVRGAAVNARAAMTAQSTVRSLDLDAIGGVGHSRRDDGLPKDIARSIIESASKLGNVRQNVPLLPDEEVTRLITENPEVAVEGLTKLGRVMRPDKESDDFRGTFDPLETKARVVGNLRSNNVDNPAAERVRWAAGQDREINGALPVETLREAVQVDIQAVYDRWMMTTKGNDLYEMNLAPPWFNAIMLYTNETGNAWAMHMVGADMTTEAWAGEYRDSIAWQPQPPGDHIIDWDRVRWVYSVQVYIGGVGRSEWDGPVRRVKTIGPLMIWRFAIYEDGEPADVNWTHLVEEIPLHKFNNALGAVTETINMCNCVNVNVAYPTRPMPRAQRRRFERMGVRFSEIHIRPASKSYRGQGEALADMEMPIHGVRGHYATYGEDGRDLLFGKYAGRFWIPPHVRGSKAVGEVVQSYVTEAQ